MKQISLLLMVTSLVAAKDYSSGIKWIFGGGNLISNWSFEEYTSELCSQSPASDGSALDAFFYECRYKPSSTEPQPHSGNYVLKVGTSNTLGSRLGPVSERILVEAGKEYEISFSFQPSWLTSSAFNYPHLIFYDAFGNSAGAVSGLASYESQGGTTGYWKEYSHLFTVPSNAATMTVSLVFSESPAGNDGKFLYFDDLIIHKTESKDLKVLETRIYADASGKMDELVRFDGSENVVHKLEYDLERRLKKEYSPIRVGSASPVEDLLISTLNLSPEVSVDYPDIQSAYSSTASIVAGRVKDELPLEIVLYAVVTESSDWPPLSGFAAEFESFTSADGFRIPLVLQGVVQGSPEYEELIQRKSTQVTSDFRGPFEPVGTFEDAVKSQYPGVNNIDIELAYAEPGVSTTTKKSIPGNGYDFSDVGGHFSSSGRALLLTGTFPTTPEYNPGAAGTTVQAAEFRYKWSRNRMGHYTATILDPQGRVYKNAFSKKANPTSETDWAFSTALYDDFGRPSSTHSPEGFSTTYEYNGMGELVSQFDSDRGAERRLYDLHGSLRLIQTSKGDDEGYVNFSRYDNIGRIIGSGTVPEEDFTQLRAEDESFPSVQKFEKGWIYDEVSVDGFQAATNISLSSLGFNPSILTNGSGRLAASYNRNTEADGPALPFDFQKLVAGFYSYDEKGRLIDTYRYIGSASVGKQWNRIHYAYDDLDRVVEKTVYANIPGTITSTKSIIIYDNRGKVASILDKNGQVQAGYSYNFRDELVSMNILNKADMLREYDIQGKLLSNRVLAKSGPHPNLFSEYLGYEGKPHPNLQDDMSNSMPRYDGRISSILRKYSSAALASVRLERFNYAYEDYLEADESYLPASTSHFKTDGNLDFAKLAFGTSPSSTQSFTYDDDFRMTSKSFGATNFDYNYKPGTHQLDNVTPNLPNRTTSAPGNFTYDPDGNMKADIGFGKTIAYNASGMPRSMTANGKTSHFYYNEDDLRVATLINDAGGGLLSRKAYLYESDLKVLKEIEESGGAVTVKNNLWGADGVLGIEREGGERTYLVKDYLGSVVDNINATTGAVVSEKAYSVYGAILPRVEPATNLQVSSESFSGKEFDEETGMTYFGARYLDAEVGIWTTPDPMGQYHNAYSFVGGDPINFIDPWGLEADAVVTGSQTGAHTFTAEVSITGVGPQSSTQSATNFSVVPSTLNMDNYSEQGNTQDWSTPSTPQNQDGLDDVDRLQSLLLGLTKAKTEDQLKAAGKEFDKALNEASRLSGSRNNNAAARMARREGSVLSRQLMAQTSRMALLSKTFPLLKIGGATLAIGIGGSKILLAADARGRYLETTKLIVSVGGAAFGSIAGGIIGFPTSGPGGVATTVIGGALGAEGGNLLGEQIFNFTFPTE